MVRLADWQTLMVTRRTQLEGVQESGRACWILENEVGKVDDALDCQISNSILPANLLSGKYEIIQPRLLKSPIPCCEIRELNSRSIKRDF
jgi:hypothetical protein